MIGLASIKQLMQMPEKHKEKKIHGIPVHANDCASNVALDVLSNHITTLGEQGW